MLPEFELFNSRDTLPMSNQVQLVSTPQLSAEVVEFASFDLMDCEAGAGVRVVSAKSALKAPRISSYFFEAPEPDPIFRTVADTDDALENPEAKEPAANQPPTRTRFKPPKDVIKLEDRLFFMLQPPLESILTNRTMRFPFKPFDFQYEGIAFLYPRYSGILADEMGLGKTMQAITAIRLLLRTGSAKRVLLICPKPLVANWLREFKTWAPEITVGAISGSQANRDWHWKQDRAMVKIANYELMIRDEATVSALDPAFDLVVLDEAQRIKNKSNSTSKVIQRIERKRSWALTGTPIENSIEDLVGICEFVSPGTVHSGLEPRQIRGRVKDLIIRRTKDLVMKDMPPRLMRDAELSLTPEQQSTYEAAEQDGVIKLNEMGQEITIKHVFRVGVATEADLQLRSCHQGQQQDRATQGRHGRDRSQWAESDCI